MLSLAEIPAEDCHGWGLGVPERKDGLSSYVWAMLSYSYNCIYFTYFALAYWKHLALAVVLSEESVLQALPALSYCIGLSGGHSTLSEAKGFCYLQPRKQNILLPGSLAQVFRGLSFPFFIVSCICVVLYLCHYAMASSPWICLLRVMATSLLFQGGNHSSYWLHTCSSPHMWKC